MNLDSRGMRNTGVMNQSLTTGKQGSEPLLQEAVSLDGYIRSNLSGGATHGSNTCVLWVKLLILFSSLDSEPVNAESKTRKNTSRKMVRIKLNTEANLVLEAYMGWALLYLIVIAVVLLTGVTALASPLISAHYAVANCHSVKLMAQSSTIPLSKIV